MNNKYKEATEIVDKIAKETGYPKEVINIVIKHFFISIRRLLKRNKEINIKGHIVFKLRSYYRKKLEKKGPNVNLRPRESGKWVNVKKRYKKGYKKYLRNRKK